MHSLEFQAACSFSQASATLNTSANPKGPLPTRHDVAGNAGLGDGRDVGEREKAPPAGHRERAQPAVQSVAKRTPCVRVVTATALAVAPADEVIE